MSRPRTIWIVPLVALVSTGFAMAIGQERGDERQAAKRRPQAPALDQPPMDMEQLLGLWQGQSEKLKTLEVDIYRIDKNPAWQEEEHYLGHAVFKTPQLAYLDFRKVNLQMQADPKDKKKKIPVPVKKNGQLDSAPYETIVCTALEVWHYRYEVKQIFIYPLDKNQRKRALEEGPLPFLFNMRAADAKQRYQMTLKGQDDKKYLVKITPLLQEDKESFDTAWINLDKDFLLPTRIVLLAPDRKSTKDFYLSHIHANEPVKPSYFVGVALGKPWKVERNPGGAGAAAPGPGIKRTLRGQPVGQSARRAPAADVGQPR